MESKRSRKIIKKLPTAAEEARHASVLLETIQKDIRLIAEGHDALRSGLDTVKSTLLEVERRSKWAEFTLGNLSSIPSELRTVKSALLDVDKRTERFEPLVNTLATDVKNLKDDMKEVKIDVKEIKERLTSTEAKLAV